MANLYERIKEEKIKQIVADFYQTILNDDNCNTFYLQNVSDIAKLHQSVAEFVIFLLGGPNNYKGKGMKELHQHMKIKISDFDLVWHHMEASFRKNKVEEEDLVQIKEIIYSLVPQIVNTS